MEHTCLPVSRTQIFMDGNDEDWARESLPVERVMQLIGGEYQYDWTGPNDASFRLWCRYNEHGLYFAVVGRDNVITAPGGGGGGDRMEVWLELDRPDLRPQERLVMVEVPLWPLLDEGYTTPRWGAGAGRSGDLTASRAEMSARPHGFFLEFNIPFIAIGETSRPLAPIGFTMVQRDWDADAEHEVEVGIGTSPVRSGDASSLGRLHFDTVAQIAQDIRRTRNLPATEMPFGVTFGNIGGTPALDVAFFMGDQIILAGTGFGSFLWAGATVRRSDDHTPLGVELRDVDGDGRQEIVYRWSERMRTLEGRAMVKEFLAVFRYDGAQSLARLVYQEVAHEIPGVGRVEAEVRWSSGSVSIRKATGTLTRDQWFDADEGVSPEYRELLLPWDTGTRILWSGRGDQWVSTRE
jgi:hypothetical protein